MALDHAIVHSLSLTTLASGTQTVATINDAAFQVGSGWADGGKYLIVVIAGYGADSLSSNGGLTVQHGGSDLKGSRLVMEVANSYTNQYFFRYGWATILTQNTPADDVTVLLRRDAGSSDVHALNVRAYAIRLDALTADDDYKSGVDDDTAAPVALSANNHKEFAAVTINSAADEDWLILATAQIQEASTSDNVEVRISRDSETETDCLVSWEGEDASDEMVTFAWRPWTLSAGSHTFEVQAITNGLGPDHLHSEIIALRLPAFTDYGFSWSASETAGTSGAWSQEATLSFTPSETANCLVLAQTITESDATDGRLQIDNTDAPSGALYRNAWYSLDWDIEDNAQNHEATFQEISTSGVTIDLDIDPDSTSQLERDVGIVVISMGAAVTVSNISGDASLAMTATGSAEGAGLVAGDATIDLTATGAIAATGFVAGNATIDLTAAGEITGSLDAAGDASITLTATGDVAGRVDVSGDASLAMTATGSAEGAGLVAGDAAIDLTATGAIAATGFVAGNATIDLTAAGEITGSLDASGDASLSLTATGELAALAEIAGDASIALTATGDLAALAEISGDASLSLTATAAPAATGVLSATAQLSVTATAALEATGSLAAAATLTVTATASIQGTGFAGAAASITVIASGDLGVFILAKTHLDLVGPPLRHELTGPDPRLHDLVGPPLRHDLVGPDPRLITLVGSPTAIQLEGE